MEENVENFRNLEQNLAKQHLSLNEIPNVLQFDKRNLRDIAPSNYLILFPTTGPKASPRFETVETTGINVFSTLDAVSQLILQKFMRERRAFGNPLHH
jgi:hypothetical protein